MYGTYIATLLGLALINESQLLALGLLNTINLAPVASVLAALIALLLLLSLTARILRIYTTQEVESSNKMRNSAGNNFF
jgi:hypothetical protein